MSELKKSAGEELVEVELFRDNDRYKNDVFVCVNGEHIQVKRGQRVKIKKKFAEVLSNAEGQRMVAAKTMENLRERK